MSDPCPNTSAGSVVLLGTAVSGAEVRGTPHVRLLGPLFQATFATQFDVHCKVQSVEPSGEKQTPAIDMAMSFFLEIPFCAASCKICGKITMVDSEAKCRSPYWTGLVPWESISDAVVATAVTLRAAMITRATSTDPSISMTRSGRTRANSVAAMACRARQNSLARRYSFAGNAWARVGRSNWRMLAPGRRRIRICVRFVLERGAGRGEYDRVSPKGRRDAGQPNRAEQGHRIVDLQVDIFAAPARTKRGLRVVERRNNDRALRAIDKRIKAARKGRLRKRLKVDDDTAAGDGHGELRTQIGPELRRRLTRFLHRSRYDLAGRRVGRRIEPRGIINK